MFNKDPIPSTLQLPNKFLLEPIRNKWLYFFFSYDTRRKFWIKYIAYLNFTIKKRNLENVYDSWGAWGIDRRIVKILLRHFCEICYLKSIAILPDDPLFYYNACGNIWGDEEKDFVVRSFCHDFFVQFYEFVTYIASGTTVFPALKEIDQKEMDLYCTQYEKQKNQILVGDLFRCVLFFRNPKRPENDLDFYDV